MPNPLLSLSAVQHAPRVLVSLAMVSLVASLSSPAHADEPDATARSAELKRQGGLAMDKLEFGAAEEAYKKAIELTPNDATLHYNLGKVHQARDNYPAAVDELERFLRGTLERSSGDASRKKRSSSSTAAG